MRELANRVRALPLRARLALVAAVVLSFVAVLLLAWPGDDGGGAEGDAEGEAVEDTDAPDDLPQTSSTTLLGGGIEIDAPEGWQEIPVPATKSPEHSPFEVVMEAAFPSPSMTLTWVVPPDDRGPSTRDASVSTITSTSDTRWAALPHGPASPPRSSARASVAATRTPPKAGSGLVRIRRPRYSTASGARSTTR